MKPWYIAGRSNAAYRSSGSLSGIWISDLATKPVATLSPTESRKRFRTKTLESTFNRDFRPETILASYGRPPELGSCVVVRLLLGDILRDPTEGVGPASFGSGRAEGRDCL